MSSLPVPLSPRMSTVESVSATFSTISNTDIKIVDLETGLNELPAGQDGEIAISGPQVMTGYWNKPEENENVFRIIDGRPPRTVCDEPSSVGRFQFTITCPSPLVRRVVPTRRVIPARTGCLMTGIWFTLAGGTGARLTECLKADVVLLAIVPGKGEFIANDDVLNKSNG